MKNTPQSFSSTKNTLFFLIGILFFQNCVAQKEFFNSKISFSESQLSNFYSSFNIDSAQVYFIANDYIYAYNKKSGVLNWSYHSGNKSNTTAKLNKKVFLLKKTSVNIKINAS